MAESAREVPGRPETLVSYATRRIKIALSDGTIAPGERLSPNSLAKEFGLSHIPVREALSSLNATGYIVHKRGHGYFARLLSLKDLKDIYHWREVLESEAYRMSVPELTDEDLDEMQALIGKMAELLAPENRYEYLELNREWHFVAFRRAGSRRVLRLLNFLWDSAASYATLGNGGSEVSHKDHIALMKVFKTRDPEKVIPALNKHRRVRIDVVEKWEREQAQADAEAAGVAAEAIEAQFRQSAH